MMIEEGVGRLSDPVEDGRLAGRCATMSRQGRNTRVALSLGERLKANIREGREGAPPRLLLIEDAPGAVPRPSA